MCTAVTGKEVDKEKVNSSSDSYADTKGQASVNLSFWGKRDEVRKHTVTSIS